MAFPVPPTDPNTPIPNDPFYYPQQSNLQSDFGPLIIGTGLSIDYETGILSANDPGTPAGVTALLAGNGIFLTANTGVITVSNTGVTDIVAGAGISVSNTGGTFTITNITQGGGTGTVKQINTGGGLTGGPITDTGTIALTQTGVAAATYSNPTITVDEYGRITYAAPGSLSGFPVQAQYPLQSDGLLPSTLSIAAASTSARGSVQLNDAVNSTSSIQAATPKAVKCAYDVAFTAQNTSVTAIQQSNTAIANSSNALSAALDAQTEAGTALACATIAQSTATSAVADAATAQTTADCAFALATTACLTANTALNSADVRIPCSAFLQKGSLLVGCGSGVFTNVPVGINGEVLTACSTAPGGVAWTDAIAGSGTVTCIDTGTGLTGGPITTVGTVCIAPTGVTPGIYTNPVVEINAEGQIVSASGGGSPVESLTVDYPLVIYGTASNPVICVAPASGANVGVVQLYNALDGTSPLLALTAQQGKVLQDQITQVCADKVSSVSGVSPISVTGGINPSVSVADGTTTTKGVVLLYDGLDSNSSTLALTANQGKILQDQIDSLGAPDSRFAMVLGDQNVALAPAGVGQSGAYIPFNCDRHNVGMGWSNTSPTKICALVSGWYSWDLNVSYCWDGAAPSLVSASVVSVCNNAFGGNMGPFTTTQSTGGETGGGSISCSETMYLYAGDELQLYLELNHTGCIYNPGLPGYGTETRSALNIRLMKLG
jgi:hypothetical protein